MIDLQFIRKNSNNLKKIIESGRGDAKKADVDAWLKLDEQRKEFLQKKEELNRKRNELSVLGSKGDVEKVRSEGRKLKQQVREVEYQLNLVEEKWQEILDWMPNIPVEGQMPAGKGEEDNIILKAWLPEQGYLKEAEGKKARGFSESLMPQEVVHAKNKEFKPRHHLDLGSQLGIIDNEQASKTSGTRFTYLFGDLVRMQYAIQQLFFNELLEKRKFQLISPPLLVREKVLYGTSHFPEGGDQVYVIGNENVEEHNQLYLVGSTEPTNFAYFMGRTLKEEDLPIKVFAYAPAFRSEAGSWGKDTKGIKRMHQFDKIEMNVVCKPEQSNEVFDELLDINEWLLQALKLPYQLALKCTGDAGYLASAKQIDPEVWLSGQKEFMEVMTDTNTTDYQARRLNIKYRSKDGETDFVHTVNDTGVAMGRILIAIMDNYQQKDGSIMVPEVLREYMGGLKAITSKDAKKK